MAILTKCYIIVVSHSWYEYYNWRNSSKLGIPEN